MLTTINAILSVVTVILNITIIVLLFKKGKN